MSNKPRIITKCVAGTYEAPNEKIIEFDGGLISFRKMENGCISVDLYRFDNNVKVDVSYENGLFEHHTGVYGSVTTNPLKKYKI